MERGVQLHKRVYESLIRDRMDNVIKFLADFQIRANNAQGVWWYGEGGFRERVREGGGSQISLSGDVALLPARWRTFVVCNANSDALYLYLPVFYCYLLLKS